MQLLERRDTARSIALRTGLSAVLAGMCTLGLAAPEVAAARADGSLSGRVIPAEAMGEERALIQLVRENRVIASMGVDAEGRFRFSQLEPDLYGIRVTASRLGGNLAAYAFGCPAARRLGGGIPIREGGAVDVGALEIVQTGFHLDVAVTSAGAPVHRAEVELWLPGVRQRKPPYASTNAQGRVTLQAPGIDPRTPVAVVATIMVGGEPVSARPAFVRPEAWKTTAVALQIPKSRVERLPVHLTTADGSPVADGNALLLFAAGGHAPRRWSLYGAARTEADGLFGYYGIPVGAWRLAVRAPGGAWQMHGVQVNADGISPPTIRLRPGVSVTLTQSLSIDGVPLISLVRRVRERMRRDFGDVGLRTLPPFGVYLVPQGRQDPTPMAPVTIFAADQLGATLTVNGVEPGRYRAWVVPVHDRPLPREYSGIRVGFPHAVREVAERYEIHASGLPPLESAPFQVPSEGPVQITLGGTTSVERAAALAAQLPPYVRRSPSSIRGMLAELNKE